MKTNRITLEQRLFIAFLGIALLAMVGAGCNTAKGFGKDIENAGEAIQDGTK